MRSADPPRPLRPTRVWTFAGALLVAYDVDRVLDTVLTRYGARVRWFVDDWAAGRPEWARAWGYGDAWFETAVHHDLLHHHLAALEGLEESPALARGARRPGAGHTPATEAEEAAVCGLHAYLRGAGPALDPRWPAWRSGPLAELALAELALAEQPPDRGPERETRGQHEQQANV
jgi:hypothetical protein